MASYVWIFGDRLYRFSRDGMERLDVVRVSGALVAVTGFRRDGSRISDSRYQHDWEADGWINSRLVGGYCNNSYGGLFGE